MAICTDCKGKKKIQLFSNWVECTSCNVSVIDSDLASQRANDYKNLLNYDNVCNYYIPVIETTYEFDLRKIFNNFGLSTKINCYFDTGYGFYFRKNIQNANINDSNYDHVSYFNVIHLRIPLELYTEKTFTSICKINNYIREFVFGKYFYLEIVQEYFE